MRVSNFGLAALAAGMGLCVPSASAQATVLDFSGNICDALSVGPCYNYSNIGPDYGDIPGVVDVSGQVIYVPTKQTYLDVLNWWDTGYGDLQGVVWGGGIANFRVEFLIVPEAGHEVSLNGFDFACFQNLSGCQTFVYDIHTLDGTAIMAGSAAAAPGGYASHGSLAVNSGWYSQGIVISWTGMTQDFGLDNINFDVRPTGGIVPGAVPEPASWALVICGFAAVGSALRRRVARVAFA